MKEALYLVIYLVSPPSAPVVPQEVIAEMPTAAHCLQEIDRIKALPYVADKLSGYYKLDASCHDEDYIKRQQ
jgi:hypothetical protein